MAKPMPLVLVPAIAKLDPAPWLMNALEMETPEPLVLEPEMLRLPVPVWFRRKAPSKVALLTGETTSIPLVTVVVATSIRSVNVVFAVRVTVVLTVVVVRAPATFSTVVWLVTAVPSCVAPVI